MRLLRWLAAFYGVQILSPVEFRELQRVTRALGALGGITMPFLDSIRDTLAGLRTARQAIADRIAALEANQRGPDDLAGADAATIDSDLRAIRADFDALAPPPTP